MSPARRLLAQMDMHDTGAGVEGRSCLARHFLRGDRHMMLFRVGQHAVQRAGDDGLVAHESELSLWRGRPGCDHGDHACVVIRLLASMRYLAIRIARSREPEKIARGFSP